MRLNNERTAAFATKVTLWAKNALMASDVSVPNFTGMSHSTAGKGSNRTTV